MCCVCLLRLCMAAVHSTVRLSVVALDTSMSNMVMAYLL